MQWHRNESGEVAMGYYVYQRWVAPGEMRWSVTLFHGSKRYEGSYLHRSEAAAIRNANATGAKPIPAELKRRAEKKVEAEKSID